MDSEPEPQSMGMAMGLSLGTGMGVAMGAVIGAVTGNVGLWIALGIPLGAGIGLTAGIILAEMQRRTPAGECPACGYPTKGLSATVCPECGVDFVEGRRLEEEDTPDPLV